MQNKETCRDTTCCTSARLAWFASRWCPQAEVEEPELDKDRASAATGSGKHAGFRWTFPFRPNRLLYKYTCLNLFRCVSKQGTHRIP